MRPATDDASHCIEGVHDFASSDARLRRGVSVQIPGRCRRDAGGIGFAAAWLGSRGVDCAAGEMPLIGDCMRAQSQDPM